MSGLSLKKFAGKMPIAGDRTLPDHYATEAINTWLYGGELRGLRPPVKLEPINPTIKKVLRIPLRTPGGDVAWEFHSSGVVPPPSYLGDSIWYDMDDPDTDIVGSILVNDSHDRWYFCGPLHGPQYSTFARLSAGQSNHTLGIPVPTDAVNSITIGPGGTGNNTDRTYVLTYQTIYGEESAPGPPFSGTGQAVQANGAAVTWYLYGIQTPSAAAGQPAYKYVNIYRTIMGNNGISTYFKLAQHEIPPTGVAVPDPYPDTMLDTTLNNQLQLQTVGWQPPPANLQGFVKMPNGFLVGWVGSDIYMSVPYQPHAWPIEYILSTEYNIVGMGVVGTTCFIATEGYPEALSGTDPISTTLVKLTTAEPCLSRGSIVTTLSGVYYASQNGLMLASPNGVQNVTESIITREQWLKNYRPAYLRAVRYQNGYLALRCIPTAAQRSGFYLDTTSLETAITELSEFEMCENVMTDIWSGEIFKIDDQWIWRWDTPSDNLLPLVWKSKEFQIPTEMNFGVYAIYWDEDRYLLNTYKGGTDLIGADDRVRFKCWINRRLMYDQPIPVDKNGKAMRLPVGRMGDLYQFEIRARAPVYSIAIAQTEKELQGA